MPGPFAGQVCLLAGTTGIAAAAARAFGASGARIVACGHLAEDGQALASELSELGIEHRVVLEDLTGPGAEARAVAAAVEAFSRVDVLFFVSGISGRSRGDGPLAHCSDEGWDAVMNLNLRAMMRLNRACVRHWLDAGRHGVILNMASVLGYSHATEHFDAVGYSCAKAAVIALTQHSAGVYARHGIRINALAPGLVETRMARRALQDPRIRSFIARKQPLLGSALDPDDCARAALFLCSVHARAITGIVLPVDAGWSVTG